MRQRTRVGRSSSSASGSAPIASLVTSPFRCSGKRTCAVCLCVGGTGAGAERSYSRSAHLAERTNSRQQQRAIGGHERPRRVEERLCVGRSVIKQSRHDLEDLAHRRCGQHGQKLQELRAGERAHHTNRAIGRAAVSARRARAHLCRDVAATHAVRTEGLEQPAGGGGLLEREAAEECRRCAALRRRVREQRRRQRQRARDGRRIEGLHDLAPNRIHGDVAPCAISAPSQGCACLDAHGLAARVAPVARRAASRERHALPRLAMRFCL